jgi:uncharacterized membrane protein YfcA
MDLWHALILLAAGVVGGALSTLIGGASIVTFPALLAAGLDPVLAACTNLIALAPGIMLGAFYDRSQLPPLSGAFWALVAASLVGAAVGAVLLIVTPVRVFEVLVPLLLGFSTVLFAYAKPIAESLRRHAVARGGAVIHDWKTTTIAILPVSVYGGYFGAGVGVLLLGVLSIGTGGDYRSANVSKNLVTGLNSIVAAAIYIVEGQVAWPAALVMMVGAVAGGYLGARLAQIVPREVMRFAVVAMGTALTIAFTWRYWL